MSFPSDPHRRHLVTGIAAVAAMSGLSAEANAQAASGQTPRHLRYLNPPTNPKNPSFTQAIEATTPGRILTIAGQQGLDASGKLVGAPGDFRAQAVQAFENIKGLVAAAGGGMEHVIKLNHYFIDLRAHFRMVRDIRLKYWDREHQPASTMVQVGVLTNDAAIYEVEAVAVLPPA